MVQQFHFWVCIPKVPSRVSNRYLFIAALFTVIRNLTSVH